MTPVPVQRPLRLALLWRGDPGLPAPDPATTRFRALFAEAAALGMEALPVIYNDDRVAEVADTLRGFDGVMVWVNPIGTEGDRSLIDRMLRALGEEGVWVSADPDVILKMGVKAVLHSTRSLGWGVDTRLYASFAQFRSDFPACLAAAGPRVLKPNRGNDGIGVWRVRRLEAGDTPRTTIVEVLAARDDLAERQTLAAFMNRLEPCFAGGAPLIDQPLQPRVADGMVRCYLSQGRVVGFSEQSPRSHAAEAPAGAETFAMASAKVMREADFPRYQTLRRSLESDWVPGLQRLLGIATLRLPALWDADFLLGPKTAGGEDSFVLCEINASSVAPFPETAAPQVMLTVRAALEHAAPTRRSINLN